MPGEFDEHPLKGSKATTTITKSYDGRYYVSIVMGPYKQERLAKIVVNSFVNTMSVAGVTCRVENGEEN